MSLPSGAPSKRNILELNANGGQFLYYIFPLSPGKMLQEKPTFTMSKPGEGPRDNIGMGFQGETRSYDVEFFLYNDGWDRANGSSSTVSSFTNDGHTYFENGEVVDIPEQKYYLEEFFHDPSFDASWTLKQVESFRKDSSGNNIHTLNCGDPIDVFIESVDIDQFSNGSRWLPATLEITVGSTIA